MASRHLPNMPTPSSLYSAYATISTSIMLFKTMFNQLIPPPLQHQIFSSLRLFWKPKSPLLSLIIEECHGMTISHLYQSAETYLCSKTYPNTNRLKISKAHRDKNISITFAQSEIIVEHFEGIELTWKFVCEDSVQRHNQMNRGPDHHDPFNSQRTRTKKGHFELSFNKKYKEKVINEYLMFVIKKAQEIKDEKKVVKLHNLEQCSYAGPILWDSVNLEHPFTFDKLAMDPKMKKAIMEDLDRFVERKEFYRKVGKAWKRGYLLYGPPGTGKSSLIAAIANYLEFDIYDLQLMNVRSDYNLRKLMLKTPNRSILVIEDIDCSVELPDRNFVRNNDGRPHDLQFSLSGLLNFIDGLWSSCGDERIIIFTTNNKEKLDPALLRPGRMDMHIHMSFLTGDGFKILASNYLDIHNHHRRFGEIEELIDSMNVTPAEVAGELMKSNDADVSLGGLSDFLKRKKIEEAEDAKDQVIKDKEEIHEAKSQKINGTRGISTPWERDQPPPMLPTMFY